MKVEFTHQGVEYQIGQIPRNVVIRRRKAGTGGIDRHGNPRYEKRETYHRTFEDALTYLVKTMDHIVINDDVTDIAHVAEQIMQQRAELVNRVCLALSDMAHDCRQCPESEEK